MLDLSFVEKYRTQPIAWGYDGLGELVFYRTYSRKRDDGMAETWVDTLKRVIEGAQEIGANYTQEEAERLFDHMFHFRALPWRSHVMAIRDRYGAVFRSEFATQLCICRYSHN